MTIKELKEHCKNIVRQTEMWAYMRRVEPQGRIYEEHKLVLELLNQELCDSRVKNELKNELNELAKDAIGREEVIDILQYAWEANKDIQDGIVEIRELPSVPCIQGHCKDCKYFELDHWCEINGVPLICAHEICTKWCSGCQTRSDGYCHLFELKESEK